MSMNRDTYHPPFFLKNPVLQSVLASSRLRTLGRANAMLAAARDLVLELPSGVRLLASHCPRPGAKGLVMMLHGWEGSVDSVYMQLTGRSLYERGYEVLRVNFRDHGPSHHLNQGIFRAFLLEEMYEALARAAEMAGERPLFLVGFSLGGNFALRLARECAARPLPALRCVACVSPLLDPSGATDAIDGFPLFRKYFMQKWRRSLLRKQELFPERYDFTPVLDLDGIRVMTDALVDYLGPYQSTQAYFDSYTIQGDDLAGVELPVFIFAAQDDPIIDFSGFGRLQLPECVRLIAPAHGGHSGFVGGLGLQSWYQDRIGELFDEGGLWRPASCGTVRIKEIRASLWE